MRSMPSQARVVLGCGVVGLLLVVINSLLIPVDLGSALPIFQRASVLAGVMAVGLMLVSYTWPLALKRKWEQSAPNEGVLGAGS